MNLVITPGALKAIAHLAMERKTGARGLRAIMVSCIVNLILLHIQHLVFMHCRSHKCVGLYTCTASPCSGFISNCPVFKLQLHVT